MSDKYKRNSAFLHPKSTKSKITDKIKLYAATNHMSYNMKIDIKSDINLGEKKSYL